MSRYLALVTHAPLEAVAELALSFGPRCAIDSERKAVVLDITGCAHLFGGEDELKAKLSANARVAIADAPRLAKLLAVSQAPCLDEVPVRFLDLDDEALVWLDALAIETVGALKALPRSELERRQIPRGTLDLIHGEDEEPIEWWSPPSVLEASLELEYELETLEPLLFVLKNLIDGLCARLEVRGEALSRAEVLLKPGRTIEALFPAPLRASRSILNVLKLKLEASGLEAPVRQVRVRFVDVVAAPARALHLWEKESTALSALPSLLAELIAELGQHNVGSLSVENRHAAGARTALAPVGTQTKAPESPWVSLSYGSSEPLRAVKAEPWSGPTSGQLLVRRQSVEWWKRHNHEAWDSLAVWVPEMEATAWVDQRLGEGFETSVWLRGWVEG